MAKATTAKPKATKAKATASKPATAPKKKKNQVIHGIDDMVNAIHEDIQNNDKAPRSAKEELTKTAIRTVLQTEQALIMGAVASGDKVQYIGFGGYEKRERSARKGRNPQTGEELAIEAKTVPAFKPGKEFKDAVK